jgi:hypothetical protein
MEAVMADSDFLSDKEDEKVLQAIHSMLRTCIEKKVSELYLYPDGTMKFLREGDKDFFVSFQQDEEESQPSLDKRMHEIKVIHAGIKIMFGLDPNIITPQKGDGEIAISESNEETHIVIQTSLDASGELIRLLFV